MREPGTSFHPGANLAFQTQQTFGPTHTRKSSPCVFQLHSISPPYSSSSRPSSGSRNKYWTHVSSSGHPYSPLPWGTSPGKRSRSN